MENQSPVAPLAQNAYGLGSSIPPVLPVKKKHWVRSVIIVLVCLIVVLLIVAPNIPKILNVFYHDIPSIDDSDLALQKIDLPDSVNGYVDLEHALNSMYAPPDMVRTINDMSDGKNWNDATATMLISKNTQALAYFAQAAHKPQFQLPLTGDPANIKPSMTIGPLNEWRIMSKLSNIYALTLAKQGKDASALETAFGSVRLGNNIQNSQNLLIGYLVGVAIKTGGLNTVKQVVATSNMKTAQLLPYINEMNHFISDDRGLSTAFKTEYRNQSKWLGPEEIRVMLLSNFNEQDANIPQENLHGMTPNEYASKAGSSYYFQPNKTKLLFANNAREMIQHIPYSCGTKSVAPIPRLTPTSLLGIWLEPNVVGEILRDVIVVSLDSVNRIKCEDRARVGETQILLALRAYYNTTKSLPASIDQLVPTYLSTIPTDPFNKQLLQYSLPHKTIFSSYSTSTILINF